jgi:hypothetical protein
MPSVRLVFRVHALQRMAGRGISEIDMRDVLENGEVIEEKSGDEPYPSRVVLGWVEGRALHVVAAHGEEDEVIVVAVYEPERDRWTDGFRRRRKP